MSAPPKGSRSAPALWAAPCGMAGANGGRGAAFGPPQGGGGRASPACCWQPARQAESGWSWSRVLPACPAPVLPVPAGPGAQPCQALCWRRLGSPHGLGGGPVRKAEADEPQGPLHSGSLCRALPARSWLQGSGRPQTTAEAGISRSSLPHRVLVGLKAIPTAAPLAGALFPAIPHRQRTVQCGHQHHGKPPAPQPQHPDPHT